VKPRACLDTTILVDYLVNGVDNISRYAAVYRLVVPSSVLWETTYILLKAKAMQDTGIRRHFEVIRYLRGNPGYVKNATREIHGDIHVLIGSYGIRVLGVPRYGEMVEEMERYGLLPSDALVVATCRRYGVNILITRDEDFKRVDFLRVIIP